MKKICVILSAFFIMQTLNAQTGVPDTLTYLKQVEASKSKFIGKPFSVLLDSLKINIVFFSPISWDPAYKNRETSTSFYFIIPEYMEDFDSYNFEIIWAAPLNRIVTNQIYGSGQRAGEWRTAAAQYYRTGIIADIIVDWD